jgi:hypothetical protein
VISVPEAAARRRVPGRRPAGRACTPQPHLRPRGPRSVLSQVGVHIVPAGTTRGRRRRHPCPGRNDGREPALGRVSPRTCRRPCAGETPRGQRGAPKGQPPRNLSGKRTARARHLWKAGVDPRSRGRAAHRRGNPAARVKLSGADDRGGDLPPARAGGGPERPQQPGGPP